jgi:tetratricopeptide (TPR) repeat protein
MGLSVEAHYAHLPDQAALVLIHNGRAGEAAEIMANRQGGSSVSAVVTALAYSEAGRFEDAKRAFDPASMIDDYIPQGSTYRRDDSTPAQLKADILLATGIKMFFLGRDELAKLFLDQSFELDDDEPLTVYMLGEVALRLSEPEDALAYLKAAQPHFSASMANICRAAQELAHDAIRKKRRAGG